MTEHLTTLLAREAETLDVPPPPSGDILGAGRRLRRRRTGSIWGGAALAVAVVAGGSVLIGTGGDGRDIAPAASPPVQVAWAVDDTVYVGTDGRPVQMPEVAQSLYYTSAGIVVRTNKDGSSDGGAPFHFQLVRTDGVASPLDLTLGDVIPSTDPSQPYLAWATMSGGRIQVVVHDVNTDQDVAKVDVPGRFTWGGWEAPPVSLSGDQVYVATDDTAQVVDWRTGASHLSDVVPGSTSLTVSGGHVLIWGRDSVQVLDAGSGKVLFHLDGRVNDASLSPDGRFAVVSQAGQDRVHDLESGATYQISLSSWAWTYDDRAVFGVQGSTLRTCVLSTGRCQDVSVPRKAGSVRYPGVSYES